MNGTLKIEVAFATSSLQKIIEVEIAANLTIRAAIEQSQISRFFPEFDLISMPVGIFGKRIFDPENYKLKSGDRIEIYRPLSKTPNQKRLERAKNK